MAKRYRVSVVSLSFCLACAAMLVVFWLLAGRIARAEMGALWFRTVGAAIAALWIVLILPVFGEVLVDEEGIHLRRVLLRRTIKWCDIQGWKRHAGGESSDTLRLQLADGSRLTLSPWYVYGRRIDELEDQLRSRVLRPQ